MMGWRGWRKFRCSSSKSLFMKFLNEDKGL
jgi:hypothetical protein